MQVSKSKTQPRRRFPPLIGSKLQLDSPPHRGDVYLPSMESEVDLTEAVEPPVKEKKGLAKAVGFALALSAGLVATSMPSVAVGAQVESVQRTAVARTLTKAKARNLLAKLPKNLAATSRGLSDGQVRVLKGGLQGESEFGPITVSHRKAFIKGSAWGQSVWPKINGQIRDARSKHKMINGREERELLSLVRQVSKMSRNDRALMAELMDMVKL